ncbi:MAG TPA: hypothetical protein VMV49_07305 [Candidatus Deferrimicrobium sp.]|nr:hypothetical protein [Candidatus Deferrimicrobium sp.]
MQNMKIRVKIRKGELPLEVNLQKKMTEEYEIWKCEILEKARNLKDLKQLRRLMYSLGSDFDWMESTGRWLEKAKPYEIICVNLRIPGLEKLEDGKRTERYTMYGILAFSKAIVESYDHLGDLERVIIEKRNKHFYAWSTVGHGFVEKWPEYFPDTHSVEEFYSKVHVVFERGDHSLVLEYPKPTYVFYHNRLKNRLRIPHIVKMCRDCFVNRSLGAEFIELDVPVITHEDLETKLEIDWNGFAEAVVELDELIRAEYKKLSFIQRIKQIFRKKDDPFYYLECLQTVMWNFKIILQEKYLRRLRRKLKESYDQGRINTNFWDPITKVLNKLDELIDQTHFIQWQSFLDPKRYSKKIGIRKLEGLSNVAIEAVATGLGKLLYKGLDDIAYPEKWSEYEKIQLLAFVIGGHFYRLLLSIVQIIQKKFKSLAPKFDSLWAYMDRLMTSRMVSSEKGLEIDFEPEEGHKEKKLKQFEQSTS